MAKKLKSIFEIMESSEPTAAELARLERAIEEGALDLAPPQMAIVQSHSARDLPPSALLPVDRASAPFHMTPQLSDLLDDPERYGRATAGGFLYGRPDDIVANIYDNPNVVFHATRSKLDAFDNAYSGLGTHVGTRPAATDRMMMTRDGVLGAPGLERMIPLLQRTRNPLRMSDIGTWENSEHVLEALMRTPGVEYDQYNDLLREATGERRAYEFPDEWVQSPENVDIIAETRERLQNEGYDSILYENAVEGVNAIKGGARREYDRLRREAMEKELEGNDLPLDHPINEESARLYDEAEKILRNPDNVLTRDSRIVFNEADLRSPTAEFDPSKRHLPNLLGSARPDLLGATALGTGGLLAAANWARETGEREDSGNAAALETMGRGIIGGVQDFGSSLRQGLETIFSSDPVASARDDSYREAPVNPLGESRIEPGPYAQEFSDLAQRGVQGVLGAQIPFTETTVGEGIGTAASSMFGPESRYGQGLWELYNSMSPENKARAGGVATVGLGLIDLIPGAAPVSRAVKRVLPETLPRDDYLPVGPPKIGVDPKSGKRFESKNQTEEEKALNKERTRINKDVIKTGEYDPIFSVEGRYHADPSYYEVGDTLTAGLPAKEQTIAAKVSQFDTPAARDALNAAFDKGLGMGDSANWYATGELQDAFIARLGPVIGPAMFKERFADAMAATTGGADPGSNLLMAHYGNHLRNKGESPPSGSYLMPHPIGGRYVTGNLGMYDRAINQGLGLPADTNPKRHNFSANFLGHRDPTTIDEQMTAGMTGGKIKAPPTNAYFVFDNIVREEADKRGVPGSGMQDVAWAGFKGSDGKPMIVWVNEMLERTKRLTGESDREVLDRFILGTGPMYSVAGATASGGLLAHLLGLEEESGDKQM